MTFNPINFFYGKWIFFIQDIVRNTYLADIMKIHKKLEIIKILVSIIVGLLKENFLGNELVFSLFLVSVLTPITLFVEGGILSFFGSTQFNLYHMLVSVILATFYNLICVPRLFPVIKRISYVR